MLSYNADMLMFSMLAICWFAYQQLKPMVARDKAYYKSSSREMFISACKENHTKLSTFQSKTTNVILLVAPEGK